MMYPCWSFCSPAKPVICPTRKVFQDLFCSQVVPVIHPIKVINRCYCCPIPRHICTIVDDEEEFEE